MPMTFPAHQGLILPIMRRWPNSFDALALSVGAAMPDLIDSLLGFTLNGYFKQWYGHSLIGIFTLDFLGGILLTWFIAVLAVRLLRYRPLFQPLLARIEKARSNGDSAAAYNVLPPRRIRLAVWSFSVFVGILSHVGFDFISHDTNLLLYPWYENPRWFPEWWYTAWFELRPLPMFGHSYPVGLHSVVWCLLTVLGIYLFFRFLLKYESIR